VLERTWSFAAETEEKIFTRISALPSKSPDGQSETADAETFASQPASQVHAFRERKTRVLRKVLHRCASSLREKSMQ
jgi:hypothetical protein